MKMLFVPHWSWVLPSIYNIGSRLHLLVSMNIFLSNTTVKAQLLNFEVY